MLMHRIADAVAALCTRALRSLLCCDLQAYLTPARADNGNKLLPIKLPAGAGNCVFTNHTAASTVLSNEIIAAAESAPANAYAARCAGLAESLS